MVQQFAKRYKGYEVAELVGLSLTDISNWAYINAPDLFSEPAGGSKRDGRFLDSDLEVFRKIKELKVQKVPGRKIKQMLLEAGGHRYSGNRCLRKPCKSPRHNGSHFCEEHGTPLSERISKALDRVEKSFPPKPAHVQTPAPPAPVRASPTSMKMPVRVKRVAWWCKVCGDVIPEHRKLCECLMDLHSEKAMEKHKSAKWLEAYVDIMVTRPGSP